MFPPQVLLAYLGAAMLVVIAPGPDNVLALSRGLSQGCLAGALSSVGAGLGIISFSAAKRQTLRRVFATGLLSNVLNPKPGLFVVAFIPQFTNPARGSVSMQLLVYGAIFALVTAAVFSVLAAFAAGLSVLALEHRR